MENFRYIVEEFRKAGGIVQLHSADALVPTIADLLRNPAAGSSLVTRASRAMAQHHGAVRRTASTILDHRAQSNLQGEAP
jgi:3-deoxy-D-manno-octulosonic-acid transferase